MNPKTQKAIRQLNELGKYGLQLKLAAEWKEPWQILISTILSARTRDEKTIAVSEILYEKYPKINKLASARLNSVMKIIRPINYYKTKSKHVLLCARIIVEKYNGDPPRTFDELLKLPGVGRKTANVFLSEIGKPAIAVDTHVAQLAIKLRWTLNKKPEKIEEDLKKLFPKDTWSKVNTVLVRFGRSIRGKKQDVIINKIR